MSLLNLKLMVRTRETGRVPCLHSKVRLKLRGHPPHVLKCWNVRLRCQPLLDHRKSCETGGQQALFLRLGAFAAQLKIQQTEALCLDMAG